MPGHRRWTASRSRSGHTEHISLLHDGKSLAFGHLFDLWQDNDAFARWYTGLMNDSPFTAWFWEHPPFTDKTIDAAAEVVLIDAPALARMRPDPEPFRSCFAAGDIAVFRNLGGDAILVAPSPDDSTGYAHFASFLHDARRERVREMWRTIAATIVNVVTDKPLWLSTSGLGVAWPHVRLDSSPKYYQHRPYKQWPATIGQDTNHKSS